MKPCTSSVGCSKSALSTPALCLDLDRFESNVRRMAQVCADHGVQWRPHAKCHKSPVIGRWLVEQGACGLTCATIREAEIMADAGITDLLIAHLTAGPVKVARLVQLAAQANPIICLDHPRQIEAISRALSGANRTVRVLIELDIGMRRVGVADADDALELARQVHQASGLQLAGLMAYEGHLLTIKDPAEKTRRILDALDTVAVMRERFEQAGLPCEIASCGGTGSYPVTVQAPGVTEIQAGGAIFMDAFYRDLCQISDLQFALTVLATVVSLPTAERAVVDAGRKAMNIEIYPPQVVGLPGVTVESLSAEHGVLKLDGNAPKLEVGQLIEFIPGYADLTNVLHPCFYGFRGDQLEREIPIVR